MSNPPIPETNHYAAIHPPLLTTPGTRPSGIIAAFSDFGFSDIGLRESDFLEKETIVEIGREPMKIQVLTGIDGVTFDACYRRKVFFDDGQTVIPFISLGDLIANKDAAPRPKDKIDLEELRRLHSQKGP